MTEPTLTKGEALKIASALRRGVPPAREHVRELNVGRDRELKYFSDKLTELAEVGTSDVKFVSAQIGAGKTHFLDLLASMALDKGFVVSKVDLDSRTTRFDHFEEVYGKLISRIATPEESSDGLTHIIEKWAGDRQSDDEETVYRSLRRIDGLPIELRTALLGYWRSVSSRSPEALATLEDLRTWLGGAKPSFAQKKRLSVTSPIGRTNASDVLRGLMGLFQDAGYKGFVVLLDEAEAITSLTRMSDRDAANENIRSIIDDADKSPGFYFVFATTPSFLDPGSAKGAATYQALYRRIRDPLGGAGLSMERTIIELPALSEDQYRELARRIRGIVEISRAGERSPITDEQLDRLADYAHDRASEQLSTLVRSVVHVVGDSFDVPDFDFDSSYLFLVEEQIQQFQNELAS